MIKKFKVDVYLKTEEDGTIKKVMKNTVPIDEAKYFDILTFDKSRNGRRKWRSVCADEMNKPGFKAFHGVEIKMSIGKFVVIVDQNRTIVQVLNKTEQVGKSGKMIPKLTSSAKCGSVKHVIIGNEMAKWMVMSAIGASSHVNP